MKMAKQTVLWGALVIAVALFGSCPANSLLTSLQQKADDAKFGVPVTSVSLKSTSLPLAVGGATATLAATIIPTNATNQNVTWSSSATGVAMVSSGVVTPAAATSSDRVDFS
jgi:uncharacterized protein YjdB